MFHKVISFWPTLFLPWALSFHNWCGPSFWGLFPSWFHMFWIFVTYDIDILAKLNIQCIASFSKHGLNLATGSVCVLPVLPLPQVFHGGRVAWPAIVVFRPKWRLLCYPTTSSRTSSNSGECCVTLDPTTNTQTQSHAGTERLRQAWDYWIKNSIWQQSLSKDATVAHSSYSISKERQLQSWLSFHLGGGMLITGAHEDKNLLSMMLLMMMINMLPLKRTIAVTWHLLCHIGAS